MTRVLRIQPGSDRAGIISEAARVLAKGGLCVFPTETVYGLAANRDKPKAVARLDAVKRRPPGKQYTLMLADKEHVSSHVCRVSLIARKVIDRFWPGPLTIVFGDEGAEGLGVRVPASVTAQEIIRAADVPVVVTSANLSGLPPAVSGRDAAASLNGLVDVIVDEGETRLKEPSTVILFRRGKWELLREGLISEDMIAKQARAALLFVCTGNSCRSPLAEVICRKLLAEMLDCRVDELEALGYSVLSAGTNAAAGGGASEEARIVAREMECDLTEHTTRPLTERLVNEADRIYTMERGHLRVVEEMGGSSKVTLLGAEEIRDPVGGCLEEFHRCAQEIEEYVREAMAKIL